MKLLKPTIYFGCALSLALTSFIPVLHTTSYVKTGATITLEETPVKPLNLKDWVSTDLSKISENVQVVMNIPKDAKIEKFGENGVTIRLSDAYEIEVKDIYGANLEEAKNYCKDLTVRNKDSYKNGKIVSEEPNGLVYSMQMKDEANGIKYQPESHMAYYLQKGETIYSIRSGRPLDNGFLDGSVYSEANAKAIYNLVKTSAKIK